MSVQKLTVRENEFVFEVSDTDNSTKPLEIYDRFGASKTAIGGFFARVEFTAPFTGTIQIHLGPVVTYQDHIDCLDMTINNDAGPHTIDITTRAHYVKLVFISGFPFEGQVLISR